MNPPATKGNRLLFWAALGVSTVFSCVDWFSGLFESECFSWSLYVLGLLVVVSILLVSSGILDMDRVAGLAGGLYRQGGETYFESSRPALFGRFPVKASSGLLVLVMLVFGILAALRIAAYPAPVGDERGQLTMALAQWPFCSLGKGMDGHECSPFNPFWFVSAAIGGTDPDSVLWTGRIVSLAGMELVLLMVFLQARNRGGAAIAVLSLTLVALTPGFLYYASRFSEDATLILLLLVFALVLEQARRSGKTLYWVLAGVCAGLATAAKATGVVALAAMAAILFTDSGNRRHGWYGNKLFWASMAAYMAVMGLVLAGALAGPGGTKDTDNLWMLAHRGPCLVHGESLVDQGAAGLLQVLRAKLSVQFLGELVAGPLLSLLTAPWCMAALLILVFARDTEKVWYWLILFSLAVLGITAWKGGDSSRGEVLLAVPLAAAVAPAGLKVLKPLAARYLVVSMLVLAGVSFSAALLNQYGPALKAGVDRALGVQGSVVSQEAALLDWLSAHTRPGDVVAVDPVSPVVLRPALTGVAVVDYVFRWRKVADVAKIAARLKGDSLSSRIFLVRDRDFKRVLFFDKGFCDPLPPWLVKVYPSTPENDARFEVYRLYANQKR